MNNNSIILEFKSLPDELKQQVADFIHFLSYKKKEKKSIKKPKFGCAKGQIILAPDFDAPLEDFKEYME